MNAAIFFSSKYGNTRQYAEWISETTGFPLFDIQKENPGPDDYDLLILGSPVLAGQLMIRKWARANWRKIQKKSIILFSVSGTETRSADLQRHLEVSFPPEMVRQIDHVPLRGEFPTDGLNWWNRLIRRLSPAWQEKVAAEDRIKEHLDNSYRRSLGQLFEKLGRYYIPKASPEPVLKAIPVLETV